MKRLALVVVGAAVAGLTACTSSTPSPAPASHPTTSNSSSGSSSPSTSTSQDASGSSAAAMPAAPARCKQAYDTWKQGKGKGLVAALNAVGSAEETGNIQLLKAVLKTTKPALTRAARYPMPTCADPRGYWPVLLMHVNAAATSKGSSAALTVAMKGVPTLTRELNAELKRTEG
jgi:hypothetical protein